MNTSPAPVVSTIAPVTGDARQRILVKRTPLTVTTDMSTSGDCVGADGLAWIWEPGFTRARVEHNGYE